jgi:hypothetical protein
VGGVWGKSRLLAITVGLGLLMAMPSVSAARMIAPWGSDLSLTPTLDTANGASHGSGDLPTRHEITPDPHDGADIALWNTKVAHGQPTAPRGGQVRAIRVKGCAIKDNSAPFQLSVGVPVNTINFQTLARQPDGSYKATATAGPFQLPFCSNSANPASGPISTNSITSFSPIHMCIARGNTVDLYSIGGFIPNAIGPSWYPEGVPFEVLARMKGSSVNAFADADISAGVYAPGARPRGPNSGWGVQPGEELMVQAVEGVGGDAYGLCPGGTADEPTSSNKVLCAYHAPYDGHRKCGREANRARRHRADRAGAIH